MIIAISCLEENATRMLAASAHRYSIPTKKIDLISLLRTAQLIGFDWSFYCIPPVSPGSKSLITEVDILCSILL